MKQSRSSATAHTRTWAAGPWDNESDYWEGSNLGFRIEVIRREHMGHLCGYIYIPKKHPLFGRAFDDPKVMALNVHGGITFCDDRNEKGWALGFDCAHADDIVPLLKGLCNRHKLEQPIDSFGGSNYSPMEQSIWSMPTYKDMQFVRAQLCKLAEQL